MANMKRCIQCGLLKSVDDFRKYTYARERNTDGRYRLCKQCEATNTTYRRMCKRMAELNTSAPADAEEYARLSEMRRRIEELYEKITACGYYAHKRKDEAEFEQLCNNMPPEVWLQ